MGSWAQSILTPSALFQKFAAYYTSIRNKHQPDAKDDLAFIQEVVRMTPDTTAQKCQKHVSELYSNSNAPRYQSKEGTVDLQGLLYMVSLCMMEVEVLTEHGFAIEELGSFIMGLAREATDWVNTIQAVTVLVYGSAKNEVSDCRH